MHRGVRVDGTAILNLRISHGLSQLQLAQAAGVSERTVRNAEKCQVLETYIANYLAVALGVPLNEIVVERPEVNRSSRAKTLIRRVSTAYLSAVIEQRYQHLLNLVHPSIVWNCCSAPSQSFEGQFSGSCEVQQHLRQATKWWEQFSAKKSDFSLSRTDAEGEMIYFHLSGFTRNEVNERVEIWQTFICRLDDNLLTSVDQSLGLVIKRPHRSNPKTTH